MGAGEDPVVEISEFKLCSNPVFSQGLKLPEWQHLRVPPGLLFLVSKAVDGWNPRFFFNLLLTFITVKFEGRFLSEKILPGLILDKLGNENGRNELIQE